jgi:hypothetical protein
MYPWFSNCLIAFNVSYLITCDGGNIPGGPPQADPALDHCNLFGNEQDFVGCFSEDAGVRGNISVNPRFCDTTGLNFTLAGNSPCLGAGTNGTYIGAFGAGCQLEGALNAGAQAPTSCELSQNYPNPFNPNTQIEYSVTKSTHVLIQVFNILGEAVVTLVDETKAPGTYDVHWNGVSGCGASVSSGVYLYRIQAGQFVQSKKMLLVK